MSPQNEKARFLIGGNGPLEALLLNVLRAKQEGDWSKLDELLNSPFGDHKSGLHGLREGMARLATLAAQEVAAKLRESEAASDPKKALASALSGTHAQELHEIGDEALRISKALGREKAEAVATSVLLCARSMDLLAMRKLFSRVEAAVDAIGSNSEPANVDGLRGSLMGADHRAGR